MSRARLEELRVKHSSVATLDAKQPQTPRERLDELRSKQPQPAQQPVVEQPKPEGGMFETIAEPALALASGMAGTIAGGVASIPQAVLGDPEGAERTLRSVQETLSVPPKTQAGQEGLESVGEAFEVAADVVQAPVSGIAGIAELVTGQGIEQAAKTVEDVQDKGIGKTAGDRAFEETGSPLFAAIAETSPDIIASIIPIAGMAKSRSALQAKLADKVKASYAQPELANQIRSVSDGIIGGKITGDKIQQVLSKLDADVRLKAGTHQADKILQISKDIKAGRTEQIVTLESIAEKVEKAAPQKSLATYMIDGVGKAKNDPLVKDAVRQGFDQGVLSAVKGASKVDRSKMAKMVSVMKKGKENALFATKNRPSDIAGQSLLQRLDHVTATNRRAGSQLDVVAKSLKGKKVESSGAIDNFLNNLDDMGVTIDGKLKPVFKGSDVEGLAAPERAINNIVKRLSSGKLGATPDAYELHRMKRFIDEVVTYGKQGEGLAGKTERILKQLRRDIDGSLDASFPRYDRINTVYADTIGAIDSLQDVAGKKMNLSGGNADKATGTLLRRMMGNAQSRVNLVDAVDSLEDVAKKYGGKFNDDIATQMLFADELDSVFGAVAKTSLQGDVIKGVKTGVERAAGGRGAIENVLTAAELGTKKLRGISEAKAFDVIENILKRP